MHRNPLCVLQRGLNSSGRLFEFCGEFDDSFFRNGKKKFSNQYRNESAYRFRNNSAQYVRAVMHLNADSRKSHCFRQNNGRIYDTKGRSLRIKNRFYPNKALRHTFRVHMLCRNICTLYLHLPYSLCRSTRKCLAKIRLPLRLFLLITQHI